VTRRVATLAEMVVRDVLRRRAVAVLLFLVPLAFYFAQHVKVGQSIRLASLGLAWAVATLALFAGLAGRRLDPRLSLSGYRAAELWAGRVLGLLGLGLAMAAVYFVIIVVDRPPARPAGLALELVLTVAIAVGLGLCLGGALPGELEGTLVVIAVVGVQMIMDPREAVARVLPFWSTREILTDVVDSAGRDYLARGVAHALAVIALLLGTAAALTAWRLRGVRSTTRRPWPEAHPHPAPR
jgi:hypothetical protein